MLSWGCYLLSACFLGSKDKVTIPTSSFPKLSASDGQSSPASPSSVSLSTSELSPSSPNIAASDEISGGDPRASGSSGTGQEPTRQPSKSRGQQLSQKRTTSPSVLTGKVSWSDSKSASPKRGTEDWADHVEHSQSPRQQIDQSHSGSLEDMKRERKAQGQRDHHSSSPRKGSKRENDPGVPLNNLEEPHSPRHPAGQQPSTASRDGKNWRFREEDAAYWQEKETTECADKTWVSSDSHQKGKRAEQEALAAQKAYSQLHTERAGSDTDNGTLGRKGGRPKVDKEYQNKHHGPTEDVNKKDPGGSSSSIQDPSCNGTTTSRKAPITPGPWKVPSSAKIQSQVETSYADV